MARVDARGTLRAHFKQIVFGANDGIVTPFAIVAGFVGAQAQGREAAAFGALAVPVFGLANLTADGVSMGMDESLSGRSAPATARPKPPPAPTLPKPPRRSLITSWARGSNPPPPATPTARS